MTYHHCIKCGNNESCDLTDSERKRLKELSQIEDYSHQCSKCFFVWTEKL